RMPAIAVTAAMADHWPDTTAGCLRAADLLAVLPLSHSAPLLQRLLHDGRSAKVTCRAATVLLEQGVPRSAFTDLLPPPLLDAAVRAAAAAPRLRLVRPRTRP
ncbi:MAG TPA: hypothetical protein VK348_00890, partial [Planctomycetota bacterium]|nr:hypothetical protein [Planctomycetota bacterium]